ncbi:sterol-binding protein [Enterovibrio norvegicus FF-33]|uniref:Ubiquinone biosynthesis accessory factor UbiT n=1 Tax=Enterovibrio norvegicus FF-454 TaxID=1185651 RepID=A0A1E5BWG2_9GAMM|nr:SCP2 domain-containing protein [Enterovibrio norvegicus]OEE57540.1 sterol-binding protein [Enterovibrio norvegicus FF-454]OEE69762.1 sterol-binding protein [Enterovibrio norvegicus FF-33]OEE85688.1 sterol-binding protein [Enterovibrio norvegicus FF-162]
MLDKLHSTLVHQAPALFRLPIKLVPASAQKALMLETLKRVFREALDDGEFEFLENRWLEVHVRDIGFKSYISFDNDKLVVQQDIEAPDVRFSGNLNDLILIAARKEDPDTLFFQRRLLIEGDTELGLEVKNLMDSVDLDSLPTMLRQGLFSLAAFVQKGLQAPAPLNEAHYAHKI